MAENPAPSSPLVTSPDAAAPPLPAEFTKLTFRSLYIRRTGPGSREMTVDGRPSDQLGRRFVSDFPITASAQPLRSNWFCRRLHRVHVY
ncbi:hypothetical protein ZEAMMB73_Zm00001d035560 [Zea mays]|uniref:Uncharacterized protein n=1 Tax=Zea mays TaxID=4577 RepID=A0A1D6LH87_MAIZE|nr:hypothetical protein ZEAMMB73_Zm00001d035560 [Zea mays]